MIDRINTEKMEEGKDRDPDADFGVYNKTFADLKNIFEEVLDLKNKSSTNDGHTSRIFEKQKSASLLFVMLKKINRLDKYRIRTGRDALQKERVRVDTKRLQLQNLLYEVNHIKREILRCYQFKSQDESIDLVDEEEFYEKAPISISRPDITRDAEHTKRLARLEWELNQRKELFALCKELTVSKQKASEEIAGKLQRLNSYAPCVASLLKATKPLQLALDMSVEQKWEIVRFIKLLPKPLYLAYMNIHAYAEASDPSVNVVILGSEDDVKLYENTTVGEILEECDGSDSDEMDTVAKTHKSYVRKEDVLTQQRSIVLQPHPLAVSIILKNNVNSKKSITLNLHYFPQLGFVTVVAAINLSETGCTTGEIMSSENILSYLYENDAGDVSPTTKILYQLKKINMVEDDCLKHLNNNSFGKPYKWAQKMCGINLFDTPIDSCGKVPLEKIIPEILNRIKISWNSRLYLIKQINALENKNLDLYHSVSKVAYVKHSCSLVLWTSVTWEDILSNIATTRFVEWEWIKPSNLFYRAVIVRGSSKLECFVSISNSFPIACPIWIFSVSWNGQHNALNNSAIKDMEYWTNSVTDQIENKCAVLSTQLSRTMSSFDIFLETEGQFYSPVEFSKDKHFVKTFSKRMRARPYRCVENGTNLTFKQ